MEALDKEAPMAIAKLYHTIFDEESFGAKAWIVQGHEGWDGVDSGEEIVEKFEFFYGRPF